MMKISVTAGFLTLLLAGAAGAAERTLMTLASVPRAIEIRVQDVAAAQRAESPLPAPAWRLLPGEPVRAATRPPDRVVQLFAGTPRSPSLLGRVVLRYYPTASGWVPQFRLDEEPLVARVNGRWQPLDPARGIVGLVQQGNALPNAEGFFPTIEFGLGGGTLAIVAWQVH